MKKFEIKLNLNKSVVSKLTQDEEGNILGGQIKESDYGGYTGECQGSKDCAANSCDTAYDCTKVGCGGNLITKICGKSHAC